mmetsp:Transcript_32817/g.84751  ORF Transcript_32817/g.84751 Transcript_32817/m.84751 type:complete len:598 (-) Transcript_32817:1895-3688(-)
MGGKPSTLNDERRDSFLSTGSRAPSRSGKGKLTSIVPTSDDGRGSRQGKSVLTPEPVLVTSNGLNPNPFREFEADTSAETRSGVKGPKVGADQSPAHAAGGRQKGGGGKGNIVRGQIGPRTGRRGSSAAVEEATLPPPMPLSGPPLSAEDPSTPSPKAKTELAPLKDAHRLSVKKKKKGGKDKVKPVFDDEITEETPVEEIEKALDELKKAGAEIGRSRARPTGGPALLPEDSDSSEEEDETGEDSEKRKARKGSEERRIENTDEVVEITIEDKGDTAEVIPIRYKTDLPLQEVIQMARYLGIDPAIDRDFLWIAEEALKATLPPAWGEYRDEQGNIFYFNEETGESSWDHPLDAYFRFLFAKLKKMTNGRHAKDSEVMQKNRGLVDLLWVMEKEGETSNNTDTAMSGRVHRPPQGATRLGAGGRRNSLTGTHSQKESLTEQSESFVTATSRTATPTGDADEETGDMSSASSGGRVPSAGRHRRGSSSGGGVVAVGPLGLPVGTKKMPKKAFISATQRMPDRVRDIAKYLAIDITQLDSPVSPDEVKDMAKYLGIDPSREFYLLPIAKLALQSPLPPDWEVRAIVCVTILCFSAVLA